MSSCLPFVFTQNFANNQIQKVSNFPSQFSFREKTCQIAIFCRLESNFQHWLATNKSLGNELRQNVWKPRNYDDSCFSSSIPYFFLSYEFLDTKLIVPQLIHVLKVDHWIHPSAYQLYLSLRLANINLKFVRFTYLSLIDQSFHIFEYLKVDLIQYTKSSIETLFYEK